MGESARERLVSTTDRDRPPALTYLGPESEALAVVRHPLAARRLAEQYDYLISRVIDRLAACWPDELPHSELAAEGQAVLYRLASTIEDPEEMGPVAAGEIMNRARQVVAASEWYRQAMLGQARPLTETWRALVLAGRNPTEENLRRRLHLSPVALAQQFVDFALVFTVEPAALLPAGVDAKYAVAEIVSALPGIQQLIIALYYHQELSFPEIANVMGLEARQTQEMFGRAAVTIAGEAGLPVWRSRGLRA
ncbi:MAG: hypothetical protein J7M38_07825 [Armatimonadetes bacterium]|nr:hypothetical protein [Armatimonadota bacterium]